MRFAVFSQLMAFSAVHRLVLLLVATVARNWEGTPRETLVREVLDLVLASNVRVTKWVW